LQAAFYHYIPNALQHTAITTGLFANRFIAINTRITPYAGPSKL
jgi:hypothetical protein